MIEDRSIPSVELAGVFDDSDGMVTSLAFSDDGFALATASEDDYLRVYDLSTARQFSCLCSSNHLRQTGVHLVSFAGKASSLPPGSIFFTPRHQSDSHVYSFSLETGSIVNYFGDAVLEKETSSVRLDERFDLSRVPIGLRNIGTFLTDLPSSSPPSAASEKPPVQGCAASPFFQALSHIPQGDGIVAVGGGSLICWSPKSRAPIFRLKGSHFGASAVTNVGVSLSHPHKVTLATDSSVCGVDLRMIGSSASSGQRMKLWEAELRSVFTSLGGPGSAGSTTQPSGVVQHIVGSLDVHPKKPDVVLCVQRFTSELALVDASSAIAGTDAPPSAPGAGNRIKVACLSKDAAHTQKGQYEPGSSIVPYQPEVELSIGEELLAGNGQPAPTATAGAGVPATKAKPLVPPPSGGAGGTNLTSSGAHGLAPAIAVIGGKKVLTVSAKDWLLPRQSLTCEARFLSRGEFVVQGTHRGRILMFDVRKSNVPLIQTIRAPQHIRTIPAVRSNPQMAMFATSCTKLHLWSAASEIQLKKQALEERSEGIH
jgi:hypothetical protein